MRLSLSGRLWETSCGYHIRLEEQISIARKLGYQGIEVRYPLLPSPDEIEKVRASLQAETIAAVFSSCAKIPLETDSWNDAMRVMKTIRKLGGNFVRVALMDEDEVPVLDELVRRAQDCGVSVLLHLHIHTLCDSSSQALRLLDRIDHPALGLLVDPIHLVMGGESNLTTGLGLLVPWIRLINLQNYRRVHSPEERGEITGYKDSWIHISPDELGEFDLRAVIDVLKGTGYDSWINVMCPVLPPQDPLWIAKRYSEIISPFLFQAATDRLSASIPDNVFHPVLRMS